MIVGESQGGKSVAFNTLARAMTACAKKDLPWPKVHLFPMNPRSVTLDELYGCFNIMTNEWTDGILSSIMRGACADDKPDQKWIVFDGPVQADWIESMNSVMDDNKLLTLINGERISMPEQVSLLFECQDLGVASPATVSRAGFVFFDVNDLGWRPYLDSWCERLPDQTVVEDIRRCVERFVPQLVEFVTEKCVELVPSMALNKVISLCNLLEILLVEDNGVPVKEPSADRSKIIEKWFLFALVWSVGGGVIEDSRKKVDNFLREIEGNFPPKDTVYEYAVDIKSKNWVHWESRLKAGWAFPMDIPFYKVLVPTVDTLRYAFVLDTYLRGGNAALAVGPVGTGKTQMMQAVIDKFDPEEYSSLNINLSSRTTASGLQEIIEARVEKRTKGVYVPHGNKKMFLFIDDLNMPVKGEYGDQPPLELLRQWVDYGVWYVASPCVPSLF
jgi:dynein heavy chain